ncbi:DUF4956 domain-containing protein [candidate division KSB1 bacterium]|nr:DUF4956 domain-containing protein [candidate division KSB1 bacterium]NIR69709.1 DUF4956 domain-containing protein [candidate division KSB1 bacterium]NIS24905.1 DUF4956 domain-containing protein [candidate division KSB1 bacterium]NIT69754.1 DUF4956 domain-containing protein [candidate division KSB1 bacterium]NIU23424.1 DUF4956 domain-containing protein [candidate division KSB1 bacterium]
MGKSQTFQDFLTTQSLQVPVGGFVLNLVLAAILAYILSLVYGKFGNSLSNRQQFARNFVLITMTTMLIISIVKSSLALSLGLVGALSIVRFRAAIKEPEELAYLFLAIAIGLGFGADQRIITVVAFGIIIGVIWMKNVYQKKEENQNLYLTVTSNNPHKTELDEIVDTLKRHCSNVSLKRFDETKELLEASFVVGYDDFQQLNESKASLRGLNDSLKITFLDNNGISS